MTDDTCKIKLNHFHSQNRIIHLSHELHETEGNHSKQKMSQKVEKVQNILTPKDNPRNKDDPGN